MRKERWEIKAICVLGAGTIGPGIAQVCAQVGLQVKMYDKEEEFVYNGLDRIQKFLKGSLERQKMTQEVADALIKKFREQLIWKKLSIIVT